MKRPADKRIPRTWREWRGTTEDLKLITDYLTNKLADIYPQYTRKEIRSLLCCAMAGRLVQEEICSQVDFWVTECPDGCSHEKTFSQTAEP